MSALVQQLLRLYTGDALSIPSNAVNEACLIARPSTLDVILRAQGPTGFPIDYPLGSGSPSAGAMPVIWRPGVPTVAGVSYNLWAEAYAAAKPTLSDVYILNDVQPNGCIIQPQSGFIPWDMGGKMRIRTLFAVANDDTFQITFADGAQLLNCAGFVGGMRANFNSSTIAPLVFSTQSFSFDVCVFDLSDNATFFQNLGAAPIIDLAAPTVPVIVRLIRGGNVCPNTMRIQNNCFGGFAFVLGSNWSPDFVSGTSSATLSCFYDASATPLDPVFNPNFLGNGQYTPIDRARSVEFTPAQPTYWAGVAPAFVADAIDRIAAVVSNNGAIPIP